MDAPPQKRQRSGSISGRLRSCSELEEAGVIDQRQKGIIKDLIISGDDRLQSALDKYEAGDHTELEGLMQAGVLSRRTSMDILEDLELGSLGVAPSDHAPTTTFDEESLTRNRANSLAIAGGLGSFDDSRMRSDSLSVPGLDAAFIRARANSLSVPALDAEAAARRARGMSVSGGPFKMDEVFAGGAGPGAAGAVAAAGGAVAAAGGAAAAAAAANQQTRGPSYSFDIPGGDWSQGHGGSMDMGHGGSMDMGSMGPPVAMSMHQSGPPPPGVYVPPGADEAPLRREGSRRSSRNASATAGKRMREQGRQERSKSGDYSAFASGLDALAGGQPAAAAAPMPTSSSGVYARGRGQSFSFDNNMFVDEDAARDLDYAATAPPPPPPPPVPKPAAKGRSRVRLKHGKAKAGQSSAAAEAAYHRAAYLQEGYGGYGGAGTSAVYAPTMLQAPRPASSRPMPPPRASCTNESAMSASKRHMDRCKAVGTINDFEANGKKRMVGSYGPDDRRKRIGRFLEKRQKRVWTKKVKYDVRKNFADSRMRVKGRFVKKEDEELLRDLMSIT